MKCTVTHTTLLVLLACGCAMLFTQCRSKQLPANNKVWVAPDTSLIPHTMEGDLIRYGRSLITNTAYYFGPEGVVAGLSNGMNCQNCHLDAGTVAWANNYSAVVSMYPRFHERSGSIQTVEKKIKDCFERSMNGAAPPDSGREMHAMVAYIRWLGNDVPHHVKPKGSGTHPVAFLSRAADPQLGKVIYSARCSQCHGAEGKGVLNPNGPGYVYPPLWGDKSYNTAASMFRLSKFAGYVKDNMPLKNTGKRLTEQEAWDVAAYVNAQPRTDKRFREDWPILKLKPVDYPFGPYTDTFSEQQHKFGPFGPIQKAYGKK